MRQNGWQGGRKSEAVRQHVFCTGFAKLFAKPIIPVQNLTDDGFRAGRVHVTLFHRRTRGVPPPFVYILLHFRKIGREILLHKAVAVGPAEIERIVRILFEQFEVILHGLANVFVDNLRILPAPFRVEVRVSNHIEGRLLAEVGLFRGLRLNRPRQGQDEQRDRDRSRAKCSHCNSPECIVH